jgi:selenide,water dikinase
MNPKKFIDYAHHGGCSAKLEAPRLRDLLAPLDEEAGFSDAGVAYTGGRGYASSVDVVLPMIDDPEVFGRIVVVHVLSDLYAVGAKPLFAMNVLALPKPEDDDPDPGATNRAIDADVREMLLAADSLLEQTGVERVGGHSLVLESLFFGLAATGLLPEGGGTSNAAARPGDVLVLTKPVGTSIATKSWKAEKAGREDFEDVVAGMLRFNQAASEAMLELTRSSCTDVSGFGLLGHLHNMLLASKVSARIECEAVPVYETVTEALPELEPDHNTRIFDSNLAYVRASVENIDRLDDKRKLLFLDAQISGGLLVAVPPGEKNDFLAGLKRGGDRGWVIGSVGEGPAGAITLV